MRAYESIATEEELGKILYTEEDTQLRRLRIAKKMTLKKLANISGVAELTIYNYESRRRDINIAASITLCKLAAALHCQMEDLMDKQVVDLVKRHVEGQQETEEE